MALKSPVATGGAGSYLGIARRADPAESLPKSWYGYRHLAYRNPRGDCSRLLPGFHPQVQFLELKTPLEKAPAPGSDSASPYPALDSGPSLVRARFQELQSSVALGITKLKGDSLPTPSTHTPHISIQFLALQPLRRLGQDSMDGRRSRWWRFWFQERLCDLGQAPWLL